MPLRLDKRQKGGKMNRMPEGGGESGFHQAKSPGKGGGRKRGEGRRKERSGAKQVQMQSPKEQNPTQCPPLLWAVQKDSTLPLPSPCVYFFPFSLRFGTLRPDSSSKRLHFRVLPLPHPPTSQALFFCSKLFHSLTPADRAKRRGIYG